MAVFSEVEVVPSARVVVTVQVAAVVPPLRLLGSFFCPAVQMKFPVVDFVESAYPVAHIMLASD